MTLMRMCSCGKPIKENWGGIIVCEDCARSLDKLKQEKQNNKLTEKEKAFLEMVKNDLIYKANQGIGFHGFTIPEYKAMAERLTIKPKEGE